MATFWEIAVHSVDHMFSLYFNLIICNFEGGDWVLFAQFPFIAYLLLLINTPTVFNNTELYIIAKPSCIMFFSCD